MKKYSIEHINKIILENLPKETLWKVKLFQNWNDIIGENLKDKIRIERIDSNTITLGVDHPAWAQELNSLSNLFKKRINDVLETNQIEIIRFKVTGKKKIAKTQNVQFIKNRKNSSNNTEISFSVKEQKSLDKIKDIELKNVLVEYYKNRIAR
ncbi:TPA: hypothetical protein DEO28_00100 [Candidatus Dependentiae bacterium]|nr:MAG: hypothetical protein UR14_C0001G0122 [candidate division TM6 bacterium GW2011_GWE2_31_21]KKP53998.1 MAG: hypothetical protein UR43_C0001G0016 [candidate division TM6 bacterium GW2011_GWF2_33_332]HBS48421.1 hypothetical protein [Candidatus Dependentiae bacterium]HBZ72905.1 hypothetical protein [Candidatus Dependentiae bacterium]